VTLPDNQPNATHTFAHANTEACASPTNLAVAGNVAEALYTFVLSSLPSINSIITFLSFVVVIPQTLGSVQTYQFHPAYKLVAVFDHIL
jgi:type III secretory pathway component EscS